MEEEALDARDVERAKTFWAEQDVDQVFNGVLAHLDHLKRVLKKNTATDRELVQALRLLESLDPGQDLAAVQVVGPAEPMTFDPCSPSPSSPVLPQAPVQRRYQVHQCCKACMSGLPSMPQSTPPFWGQNPLKVPLLCGFWRLSASPRAREGAGPEGAGPDDSEGAWSERVGPEGAGPEGSEVSEEEEEEEEEDWAVVYKAPCGKSLRNHDDVTRFLFRTESHALLQPDFFSFNPAVRLDPPPLPGPRRPELDLSRGLEPTPVELIAGGNGNGDGGEQRQPPAFRYRRDRWPHGCFLSRGPLFSACCDCPDGCSDAASCACVAVTTGGRCYTHHRLTTPVPSGLYECGPWCGCDRSRCQNRLVQRGIRVRLQVFQTEDRGWGVRCRDDLDRGTFVCVYTGVVLQRALAPPEAPPPKLPRSDRHPSDDEVEVVTEWLAPAALEGRGQPPEAPPPTSLPLHVPVIQRPADAPDQTRGQNGPGTGLRRAARAEDVYILDARTEGNVSRFINHSCSPNLFVQNVFTDCHDPAFPLIAFFTDRVVRAGTELTWNYSANTLSTSLLKQEVPCLCGSDRCRGRFTVEGNLCDVCEVKGQGAVQSTNQV